MATLDELTTEAPPEPPRPGIGPGRRLIGMFRRPWRWLTSMRTALILLFLLALAAIPGSLLPQRNLNVDKVNTYLAQHRILGPLLDHLWAYNVFASPWFSAIYLLLFVSLIGCLIPRLRAHIAAVLRVPPEAPARLERLPVHAEDIEVPGGGEPAAVAARLHDLLRQRRFRVKVREQADGGITVSAEKGHLKETGNILFHFSLLAILVAVALGSWWGYHADRLVVQGADQGFCNTLQQFDDYGLGARVNPASLEPVCLDMTGFDAQYLSNGEPSVYKAFVNYTIGDGAAKSATIQVNHPLRLDHARIYLLGTGYAPVVKYTDKYGHSQTQVAPFLSTDAMQTSTGVIEFPDANVPATGVDPSHKQQVAFSGVFLPTLPSDPSVGASAFPAERNPALMLTEYEGDLGLDAGIPSSVYSLDQHQIDTGRLKPVGKQVMLKPGQTTTLSDGGTLQFIGTRPWATMQVRYDPGETLVLIGAVCLLLGLIVMLLGKRLRVWFRVPPEGPVSAGALARSLYPGFKAEFESIVKDAKDARTAAERSTLRGS
ncbi:cytochrome c biogenesis protein ResB [Rugosimonospora acidiphila]|uniref:Cytochrome c biogenesis protein ResB n=1 Tax=Rugosimonospora acidiphila TaxID=556531 RepID=A0ABP9RGL2_9ACTN